MINPKSRHRLFWVLQTSGWLLYLAFIILVDWVRGSLTVALLTGYTTTVAAAFLLTLSIGFFYRKIKIQDHSIYSLSLRAFLFSFGGANVMVWISIPLEHLFSGPDIHATNLTFISYLGMVISWLGIFLGWSALYFGLKFWQEWMVQKEKADRANALAQTAQLQMLRYRMNPHFLFNTLNSIRALISEDKASAKSMVTELSDYLRYSLVSRNYANVPFKDELESVRHYFNIQKMRYENKLDVLFDIEPAAEEFPIVSFLLHPLVENSVKHGLRASPLPLKIRIDAKVHHGILQIDVINSGSWIGPSDLERNGAIGKGLDNVRQRLAEAYPGKHRFEILEKEGTVQARLAIGPNIRR